ncbi:hypothetical protein D9M70_597680 [compost metagenome]
MGYIRENYLEPENVDRCTPEHRELIKALIPRAKRAKELTGRMLEILEEALVYRGECLDLLNACRTRKQLEELFPEAAALLPAPEPKVKALVPTELAAKVRKQLKEGVPA